MGGLTNSVLRALARLGLADLFGASRVPIYVLNVVYPLVPEEVRAFCAGKRAVLVVEEGSPDYIEQQINVELRRADIQTRVLGKGCLPATGEYTVEVADQAGSRRSSPRRGRPASTPTRSRRGAKQMLGAQAAARRPRSASCRRARRTSAPAARSGRCSPRIKLVQRELGPTHICGRHRLPLVRDLRAVLARQLDPRLRHVARERGRRRRPTWSAARSR